MKLLNFVCLLLLIAISSMLSCCNDTEECEPISASAGEDIQTCESVISLSASELLQSETGNWKVILGADGFFQDASLFNTAFTGNAGETYVLRWTVANKCNSASDEVQVIFNYCVTQAEAGPDQTLSGEQTTLAALTPLQGTGKWSVVSGVGGTFENDAVATTIFKGVSNQVYVLKWTVTNGTATSSDEVQISFVSTGPLVPNYKLVRDYYNGKLNTSYTYNSQGKVAQTLAYTVGKFNSADPSEVDSTTSVGQFYYNSTNKVVQVFYMEHFTFKNGANPNYRPVTKDSTVLYEYSYLPDGKVESAKVYFFIGTGSIQNKTLNRTEVYTYSNGKLARKTYVYPAAAKPSDLNYVEFTYPSDDLTIEKMVQNNGTSSEYKNHYYLDAWIFDNFGDKLVRPIKNVESTFPTITRETSIKVNADGVVTEMNVVYPGKPAFNYTMTFEYGL